MKKNFLKDLTLIIPTYQRHFYIKRSLKYWSKTGVKVIVVDGSKQSLNYSYIKKLNSNIKYIHNNKASFQKRILIATNKIKTKYVMLCFDDEFFILSALSSCIRKLESNKNIVSCCGQSVHFGFKNNEVYGKEFYEKLKNFNITFNDPTKRVTKHFSNYTPAQLCAIHSSKAWKFLAKFIFSKEYTLNAMWELKLEYLFTLYGKIVSIPELMWLRSGEKVPTRFRGSNNFDWWYQDCDNEKSNFIGEMKNSCKRIYKELNIFQNTDVEKVFDIYFQKSKEKRKNIFRITWILFVNNTPAFLKRIVRYLMGFFIQNKLRYVVKKMSEKGIKIDFQNIILIENIIKLRSNK